jgi:hypothetical protein
MTGVSERELSAVLLCLHPLGRSRAYEPHPFGDCNSAKTRFGSVSNEQQRRELSQMRHRQLKKSVAPYRGLFTDDFQASMRVSYEVRTNRLDHNRVPELTCGAGINLNARLSLQNRATELDSQLRAVPAHRPQLDPSKFVPILDRVKL